MREGLVRLARQNGAKARESAARLALLLRVYRRNPGANEFLRAELEQVARKTLFHMRQAAITGWQIERLPVGERRGQAPRRG